MIKQTFPKSILIFGCGNMGGAMLRGWVAAGVDPRIFSVVDPVAINLPDGVAIYRDAAKVERRFDHVILGIKPQMLDELAPDIGRLLSQQALLVSILAGTMIESLSRYFDDAKIVRLMPNLAACIGKSPLGLWSPTLDSNDKATVEHLFMPLGQPVWLKNETQMDAVTALAGSGPAFVFRFIDALAKAGCDLGLDPDQSAQLALMMVHGSACLAANADISPAELAARVTSPGGTTAAGLAEMDRDDAIANLMLATLHAAAKRGAELAFITNKEG